MQNLSGMPNLQHVAFEYIADLNLYEHEKPYYLNCSSAKTMPEGKQTNIETIWQHNVAIEDIRGREADLSFDKEGFQYLKSESKLGTRFDDDEVKRDLEELTVMIREEMRAEKALCYDFRVRAPTASQRVMLNISIRCARGPLHAIVKRCQKIVGKPSNPFQSHTQVRCLIFTKILDW